MRTLLIDNHDSFTYNLYQLLAEVNGEAPIVVKNDEGTWEDVRRMPFDNIVVSPGPGRPERRGDMGMSTDAVREAGVPLLGVCLGHQGIGHAEGAEIRHAPEPFHGRISRIFHDGAGLFQGIEQGFSAVRYHSLIVARPLPERLACTAWLDEPNGHLVMGIRHRARPLWGVQFHPESISTAHGRRLCENFRDLTEDWHRQNGSALGRPAGRTTYVDVRRAGLLPEERPPPAEKAKKAEKVERSREIRHRKLPFWVDPERVFVHRFGASEAAFWLDSSLVAEGLSRFSFMGDAGGPLAERLCVTAADKAPAGVTVVDREGLFARIRSLASAEMPEVPFDFVGGIVGVLGYGFRAALGAPTPHRSRRADAEVLFADRVIAFDHALGEAHLIEVTERGAAETGWIGSTEAALRGLPPLDPPVSPDRRAPVSFRLARSKETYLADIQACLREIRDGESYEACLTNAARAEERPDPLALYRILRAQSPAPFAAYLRFGDLAIASASPERFLRIDRARGVEAKPIKGTARRGATREEDAALRERLRASEKDQAENRMIVDLLRNDLGRVCEVGTVRAPKQMDVETYAQVHQLVSTVTGRLAEGRGVVDALEAAFPGGSMTGAPKERTMEILDRLEGRDRGVYSGAIGYFGLGGTADLNIVIRTAVIDETGVSVGAGGAIVALSAPEDEYEEMALKARPVMRAVAAAVTGDPSRMTFDPT